MTNFNQIISKIIKYQLILLVGILVLVEGLLIYQFAYICWYDQQPVMTKNITINNINNAENLISRRIDGLVVDKGRENLTPVAVTIDNHFDSWPNYGLSGASVVYETCVEGSATRFLAIYTPEKDSGELAKIGPIRSTRPYFVELAKEYGALLAHSGGSPAGLKRIEELGVSNLEEIAWWGPDYFWRVYSRPAPHNLFTSSDNLAHGVVDWQLKDKMPDYQAWQFNVQIKTNNSETANKIKIKFSAADVYNAAYEYGTTTQSYLRFQGNEKQIDALNNKQLAVQNVVIQFVPQEVVLDNEGRIKLNLIGQGNAWIFRDGLIIRGNWQKSDYNSRTIFYDETGNEIKFKPGNTWIEILPGKKEVIISS